MKFHNFSTFVVHFCPPGSGLRKRIRIHWPDWIRIQFGSGSATLQKSPVIFDNLIYTHILGRSEPTCCPQACPEPDPAAGLRQEVLHAGSREVDHAGKLGVFTNLQLDGSWPRFLTLPRYRIRFSKCFFFVDPVYDFTVIRVKVSRFEMVLVRMWFLYLTDHL